MRRASVLVAKRRELAFPPRCLGCAAAATPDAVDVTENRIGTISFPACESCASDYRRWRRRRIWVGFGLPIPIALGWMLLMSSLPEDLGKGWVIASGTVEVLMILGCGWYWCRSYAKVDLYDLVDEVAYEFQDQDYASRFSELNAGRFERV